MRYDLNDSRSAIRTVQAYLLELYYAYEWADAIAIDGVYDERTRNAVLTVQERYGLEATGIVDRATHRLLYDKYLTAIEINRTNNR